MNRLTSQPETPLNSFNLAFIEELYVNYLRDPSSVPPDSGPMDARERKAQGAELVGGVVQVVINGIATVIWSGVILLGGFNMKNLADYRLAIAASIVSMLPCNICCVIGLPIGVWSLIVLMQPDVKNNFTA